MRRLVDRLHRAGHLTEAEAREIAPEILLRIDDARKNDRTPLPDLDR